MTEYQPTYEQDVGAATMRDNNAQFMYRALRNSGDKDLVKRLELETIASAANLKQVTDRR